MATNSTLLQQAFELRKANPNMTVGDAVSQVKANTTPAPVTPLPTTPQTPLPTAKAGDVVVGVNGEKFVQANNQDLSTNVTGPSQVVNQSGQDMSKLEQVQAQAFGRREGLQTQGVMPTKTGQSEQDINKQYGGFIQDNGINNVQPLASKPVAPTPTTTPTTKTTPVQVQPTDENSIMTVLKTNGPITDAIKNSPSYTQVKQVYDKVKQFSTYSVNNLVTALNNGAILPGTKVYNEMLNDPALRQKLTEAQVFTAKQPVNTQAVTQSVSNEILANNHTTAGAFADGTLTPDEYSKLTNTPEVIAKASDVEAKTNKYNTLKAEYDDIETQVNKDFAGSPFADAIIADRQKAKYKNLVLAKGELDSAIGTLTELKSTAANIFETNLKLYQDQRQQDNAYKMAQYQAQLSKDAAQYQNQLQQGNVKFQTLGDKVYKEQNGQLIDTGISAKSIQDKKFGVIGQHYDDYAGAMVNDYGFVNENTGEIIRVGGGQGNGGGGGAGGTRGNPSYGTSSGITSAADFTKSKEGFRQNAYYDVNGWAIGYGQHSINGVPVKPTDTISEATATADLNNRIGNAKFNSLVSVPLSEPQKAALYSLEHNVGGGVWTFPNGKKIIDQINSGDFQGASQTLASSGIGTTNASTHQVLPGLVARRNEEAKLLLDTGKQAQKEYTATDEALFNKFLSGKDDKSDSQTLRRLGYTRTDIDNYAKSKPATTQLSDDQRSIYNSQISSFRGNQVVKDYEQQIGQVSNIVDSLSAKSGPGDIASVFQFMKTLDPASTVREGEFAMAAKSAGIIGSIQNTISKLENGEVLNDEQKKQFAELSKAYLANKGRQYDRLYDDMARVTQLSGIPTEYLPKRASETVKQTQQTQTQQQTQQSYTKKDNPLDLNL